MTIDTAIPTHEELLERQWDAAMEDIYQRAGQEVGYWAGRFLQMLRRRGGLGTARYILHAKTTSDGYARLRAADRLDLTVEAYALHPEFAPLFTDEDLALARTRLSFFKHVAEAELRAAEPPPPELAALLAEVAAAAPDHRHEYRERVTAFGPPALSALEAWVAAGNSAAFALKVFESIGKHGERLLAADALRKLRAKHPELADLIDLAIAGLRG